MATQREVASHLDLTDRAVRDLISRGVLPREKGRLELKASRVAYIRHLREVAAGRQSDGDDSGLDLVVQRARLAKEQADEKALTNAQLRREVVPSDDVERGYITLATTISQRARAIAAAMCEDLAAESDPAKCEELLENAVDDALSELANIGRQLGDDPGVTPERGDEASGRQGAASDEAAAEVEPEKVGRSSPHRSKRHKSGSR